MRQYPKPDYEEFLVQVVYGPCTDYLSACVSAPYLDLCRTMHGFGKVDNREAIRKEACSQILNRFEDLRRQPPRTQEAFDQWHRNLSISMVELFRRREFTIYGGQTQKWVNIAFKNIFACSEKRVPGFHLVYSFCHMPIDNVVLGQLKTQTVPVPDKAWSRWSYDEYLDFQKALRARFAGQPLLNVEHQLWIEGRKNETTLP